jgi:hypothetical protein
MFLCCAFPAVKANCLQSVAIVGDAKEEPPMRARGVGMAIAAVLGVGLILDAGAARAEDPIGQVKTSSGAVTVARAGASQPIKVGDKLFQSDVVATGGDGSVGITFLDDSMMSLGPDSELALDQFAFNTTTHEGEFDSSLKRGTLAVKSGQLVQQTPEAMKIKTPAAVLGVRGTEFLVRAAAK